jgi:AraC family transcriptional regulator of adaptative response/methylated-DNA-[protein]-cysteine methyltransferase
MPNYLNEKKTVDMMDANNKDTIKSKSFQEPPLVKIERMTPFELKDKGKNLFINYSFGASRFGNVFLGSTTKGICHLTFVDNPTTGLNVLKDCFPNATFTAQFDEGQKQVLNSLNDGGVLELTVHLSGTAFQLKVWEALLKIPFGQLSTYGDLADKIENPRAFRAVGSALGKNPIAILIPCHRVVRTGGGLGGYMWGSNRKAAIIEWEASQKNSLNFSNKNMFLK